MERFDKCPNCFKPHNGQTVCGHCGFDIEVYKMPENALPPFTVLEGKYMLGRTLGMGGFGITYLGWDMNLETVIAIKEYYPGAFVFRDTTNEATTNITITGSNKDMYDKGLKRYVEEAKNLSKFYNLPGIVSVKDFFYANETAYMVMEYVNGITLKAHLKNLGGKMSEAEVLTHMKPIIESLQQVHERGLVHRDISPDNIMVDKDGKIKLIDFGSVRGQSLEGDQTYTVILKHGYAPQEQYYAKGKQGPWTDVYSLCATMYKMLTGNVPPNSIERMSEDTYLSPSACGVSVSPNTERVLNKGLAIRLEDRYQDLGQLKDALYNGGANDCESEQATVLLESNTVVLGDANEQKPVQNNIAVEQNVIQMTGATDNATSDNTVLVNQADAQQTIPQVPAWNTDNAAQNQMSLSDEEHSQNAVSKKNGKSGKNKFLPIILVVALIAVVGVIIGVVFRNSSDDEKETEEVVESTRDRDENETDEDEFVTEAVVTTEALEVVDTTEEQSEEYVDGLSSNWEDFQVAIDGEVYQFPMSYSEWMDKGWTSNGEKFVLSSGEVRELACMNDSADFGILVANYSLESKTADECYVIGIRYAEFWHMSYDEAYYIDLPGGVYFDLYDSSLSYTMNEIETVFGHPDEIDDLDFKKIYLGTDGFVEFGYDEETGLCTSLLYCCLKAPENVFVTPNIDYMAELPQLSAYVAPSSTTDRFDSIVKLLGVDYKLPVPMSVLMENGWVPDEEIGMLRPCQQMYTSISKNGKTMHVYLNNYSLYDVGVENLYVDYVYAPLGSESADITLPGNITIGTFLEDVQELYADIPDSYKAYTEYDDYVMFEIFYPTEECCIRAEYYAVMDSSGRYYVTDCMFWRDMTATSMLLENIHYIGNEVIE